MKIAWYVALVLITLTGLLLLWQFSTAVVIFLLSLALAAAFRPLIEFFTQKNMPKGVALIIAYGFVLFVIVSLFFLVGEPLAADLQNISNDLLRSYEQVKNFWLEGENVLLMNFADQLPSSQEIYSSLAGDASMQALQTVLGFAEGTFSILAQVGLVLVLSLYWSADQIRFERLWLSLLPVESRWRAREIWQAIEEGVGQYIRREAAFSLISGLLLWMGFLALGIHYPALLALLGVVARIIPWLGPFLVLFLPLLFGSVYGVWAALGAVLLSFFILVVLELTIGNHFFPRRRYSSILLVIILVALAESYGMAGIVLATILTVALQILFGFLLPTYTSGNAGRKEKTLAAIKLKLEEINSSISEQQEKSANETGNLVARLNELISQLPPESTNPPNPVSTDFPIRD